MFKKGDKVIVKTIKEIKKTKEVDESSAFIVKKGSITIFVKPDMSKFCDKSFTIKKIIDGKIILENNYWYWGEWMLKPFNKQLELFE